MTRRNINSQHRLLAQTNINGSPSKKPTTSPKSKSRIESPAQTKQPSLSLYIPHSRRKNSPKQYSPSPRHTRSSKAEEPTLGDVHSSIAHDGAGTVGDDDEEGQSDDVDDDNICLVCVAKCTCGKTQTQPQQQPLRQSPIESTHFTRRSVKLRHSSPGQDNVNGKGRGHSPSQLKSPIQFVANGHSYSTRSHANVIIRDGRGHGKNETSKKRRRSEAMSEVIMDISDVNLDEYADEEKEESSDDEDDEDDDIGDTGDDLDLEEEEERNIIEEETRRMKAYSDDDDDADEEDEVDEEEDIFQEAHYSSSESSPDEDHEFYQNDLYLDAAFCQTAGKLMYSTPQSNPARADVVNGDPVEYDNPILQALIEEQGLGTLSSFGGNLWDEGDDYRVGWECFVDGTDVEMGDDWMHVDDESIRIGGGDTTDEEDFKLLAPAAPPPKTKRKQKKSNEIVADVITTAHQAPPLATWERDGNELTIIDSLPSTQSSHPPPAMSAPQLSFPAQTPDIPAFEDYFDSTLLVSPTDNENGCVSDASVSSNDTVTRNGVPRPRKDSTATATSIMTDAFTTPITTQGRDRRKVPLGSYRRKVMLGERTLEAQEKSIFLKEWYTLQERRSQRKFSKFQIQRPDSPFFDSSPARGRRRDKLRTARRERRDHGELDMSFIKRRRTSDVQGNGSSSAAVMERLGLEMGEGEISEDDDDDYEAYYEEFGRDGSRVLTGVQGERMVLDDDLELAHFIVPPPGGIDLSPLFGAVDAS